MGVPSPTRLLNLLRDPEAKAAFKDDPNGFLASCGDISPDDVHDALVLLQDNQRADFDREYNTGANHTSGPVHLTPPPPAPEKHDGESDHEAAVRYLTPTSATTTSMTATRSSTTPSIADRHRRRRLRPGDRHRLQRAATGDGDANGDYDDTGGYDANSSFNDTDTSTRNSIEFEGSFSTENDATSSSFNRTDTDVDTDSHETTYTDVQSHNDLGSTPDHVHPAA